jgi:hypothetical protein
VPTVRIEQLPAAQACSLRGQLFRLRLVVFPPPFHAAFVTAEAPVLARTPRGLKFFAAIRADLRGPLPVLVAFLPFLSVILRLAAVRAKSPIPPSLAALLNVLAALRAGVCRHTVIPLGVVVLYATRPAAIFLPADVACWIKRLSATQAFFRLVHDTPP